MGRSGLYIRRTCNAYMNVPQIYLYYIIRTKYNPPKTAFKEIKTFINESRNKTENKIQSNKEISETKG